MARERKPSIIFIDEIDSMCGDRSALGTSEYSNRLKAEFLVQMDGVGKDAEGVFILAATNIPWTLDPAMRRRFQKRIHIPLPDKAARIRLFEIGIQDIAQGQIQPFHIQELGRRTEGFSGSDISIAIQDALMRPLKQLNTATHYKEVSHVYLYIR